MNIGESKSPNELTEHFFRNEYGKLASSITKILGTEEIATAEDIVQETLLIVTESWAANGISNHPKAYLYKVAKNTTLQFLKRKKYHRKYIEQTKTELNNQELEIFSENDINDDQLKMMFVCCHPSISEESQIALILKILGGFSIKEIASAYFTSSETINKRLVRGRKQLRKEKITFALPSDINQHVRIILKTIYLIFNEGYSPAEKNLIIRYDLCFEAIRLTKLLIAHPDISDKSECFSLLALMYLNVARFQARVSEDGPVEMEKQDRNLWDQELIGLGVQSLSTAMNLQADSPYLVLATISAHYCIAPSFAETNWEEILKLYDTLIEMEGSPLIELNRIIVFAKINGAKAGIQELSKLRGATDIDSNYLFHITLGRLYKEIGKETESKKALLIGKKLAVNRRDKNKIEKIIHTGVPISNPQSS